MADQDTIPKQAPSKLNAEIFEETSTTSKSDQSLGRTDQSISVPSATEVTSSGTKINQDDVATSDVTAPPSGASSTNPAASHVVVGVPEDEQHPTEDDPTSPLIPPGYGPDAPPIRIVDYRTYEPPPPPRPSWIQCACCCFITTYNIHYARKIRNSRYMLLVLIALLAIPMSALYFGAAYKGSCPLSEFSPVLVILMGLVGIIMIVVRFMTIAIRLWDIRVWNIEEPPRSAIIGLTVLLMVFMPIEMFHFYTRSPNFDNPKDPLYCREPFYYYVFYMNFVVLVIGILSLLLHIPMKPRDPVQIVPREYFDAI